MKNCWTFFLYERADYELLEALDEIIGGSRPQKHLRRLFDPYLHPRGIKELAARKEIRLVYAMLKMLDSTDSGEDAANDRISALKSLRAEVLDGNPSSLRMNTARILLQIMKLLIRSAGDQPQAGSALKIIMQEMSPEAQCIMLRSQFILKREKDISQLLVDGLVGKNFARALSFYLDFHPVYLKKWII